LKAVERLHELCNIMSLLQSSVYCPVVGTSSCATC